MLLQSNIVDIPHATYSIQAFMARLLASTRRLKSYLGTQLGEDRSTSQVAQRFICTGRAEDIVTGLKGCRCGPGAAPLRGSPPFSVITRIFPWRRGDYSDGPLTALWSYGNIDLVSQVTRFISPHTPTSISPPLPTAAVRHCLIAGARASSSVLILAFRRQHSSRAFPPTRQVERISQQEAEICS